MSQSSVPSTCVSASSQPALWKRPFFPSRLGFGTYRISRHDEEHSRALRLAIQLGIAKPKDFVGPGLLKGRGLCIWGKCHQYNSMARRPPGTHACAAIYAVSSSIRHFFFHRSTNATLIICCYAQRVTIYEPSYLPPR
eukprot:GHVT01073145.1.p1 GENE.GHVT01073145.1~~GHVT01073145.1.p1  ORF type:complete len:138 (-),score=9.33 GHVT01073145.1:443-856(-)